MSTESSVMGDLELDEIMKMVGEDIGTAPTPPVTKAKEPELTPAPVEDVPVIEDEPEVTAEAPEVADELIDAELEALLGQPEETAVGEVSKASIEEEEHLEAAIRPGGGEVESIVIAASEIPEELLSALETPELPNVLETSIAATVEPTEPETVIEAKAAVSTAHPMSIDDDDWEPVKRDGVVYYIDPSRLKRDVAFSPHNIDDAMMTHASKFVHYAVQSSLARGQFERMKAAFEILESKLDGEHRLVLKEENPKTTEAQIRAAVVSDERWKAANARLIETRTVYELAQDAKEAFTMRRDTLLQVAKNVREERGGQLRLEEIREEQKGARERVSAKFPGGKTGTTDA